MKQRERDDRQGPGPRTVLVVEDDPLAARTSMRRIEAMGWCAVGPVARAEDAVVWVEREPPDLVLMDVNLAGAMTGPEAALTIFERTAVRSVFVTGSTDRATIESCKAAHPLGYMIKPVHGTMFETTMELAMHSADTLLAHKREQLERQRVEMRHAQVLRHSADAVVMLDARGLILVFSPSAARMFGVHEASAIGAPFHSFFAEGSVEFLPPLDASGAWQGASSLRCELNAHGRDGEFPVDLHLSWFLENEEVLAVAIVRDMSESAMLKRQLDHAQRLDAVSKLTPSIVHDFNNLLQAIAANQYVLSLGADTAAQKLLSECAAVLEQGAGLTNQLLDLSSFRTRQPSLVSLEDAVKRTASVANRLLAPHVRTRLELGPGLRALKQVPGEMEQVLLNLVLNARQAMPHGGDLVLGAICHPELRDHALVTVEDTGAGMPPEVLARAFEPFFTTRAGGKGSGLGLSTVKRLVETWGGGVELESELGKGARCLLSVPFANEVRGEETRPVAHPSGHENILLLEPAAHVRAALLRSLTAHGYTVIAADDFARLSELLDSSPRVDAIVCSSSLSPKLDQRSALVPLLQLCGNPEAPPSPGSRRLTKPFTIGELLRALRALLDEDEAPAKSASLTS